VLILPLPPLLLDFSLAASIIFSVLILVTALFIEALLCCRSPKSIRAQLKTVGSI